MPFLLAAILWKARAHFVSGRCELSMTLPTVTVKACRQALHWIKPGRCDLPSRRWTFDELQCGQTALPNVRQIGFERLREAVKTDILRFPDYGQAELHPTAGAVAVGARKILIAWNIELDTADESIAAEIASVIREANGGFPGVRALGLSLASKGITQVSINLTDYEATPPHQVLPRVEELASKYGVAIRGTELIGLIPRRALDMAAEAGVDLRIDNLQPDSTIEARLAAAGL